MGLRFQLLYLTYYYREGILGEPCSAKFKFGFRRISILLILQKNVLLVTYTYLPDVFVYIGRAGILEEWCLYDCLRASRGMKYFGQNECCRAPNSSEIKTNVEACLSVGSDSVYNSIHTN